MTAVFSAGEVRESWRSWAERWAAGVLFHRPSDRREWLERSAQEATDVLQRAHLPAELEGDRVPLLAALYDLRRLLAEDADAGMIDRAACRVGAAWATFAPPRHLGEEVARHDEA